MKVYNVSEDIDFCIGDKVLKTDTSKEIHTITKVDKKYIYLNNQEEAFTRDQVRLLIECKDKQLYQIGDVFTLHNTEHTIVKVTDLIKFSGIVIDYEYIITVVNYKYTFSPSTNTDTITQSDLLKQIEKERTVLNYNKR